MYKKGYATRVDEIKGDFFFFFFNKLLALLVFYNRWTRYAIMYNAFSSEFFNESLRSHDYLTTTYPRNDARRNQWSSYLFEIILIPNGTIFTDT